MRVKKKDKQPMYVLLRDNGQVFAGLKYGYFHWSDDWNEAKPLYKESTKYIFRQQELNLELIEENEFFK